MQLLQRTLTYHMHKRMDEIEEQMLAKLGEIDRRIGLVGADTDMLIRSQWKTLDQQWNALKERLGVLASAQMSMAKVLYPLIVDIRLHADDYVELNDRGIIRELMEQANRLGVDRNK